MHDSLQLQTENLRLIAHVSRHLLALIDSPAAYHNASGTHVAAGVREFLLAASSDFLVELRNSTAADPWRFGFAVVQPTEHVVIGLCGFAGPPDSDGLVEIAYSISPDYQGNGFATEVATALVDFASSSGRVRTICAHTLPEMNASTRVLEKCGFRKTGEILDFGKQPRLALGKKPAKIDIKHMTKEPPCFGLRHSSFPSHLKAFAKVKLSADGIVDQKIFCALAFDAAFVN